MATTATRLDALASPPPFARISWGAILAGTLCAFSIQLLMNLLGMGIGFAAVDLSQGEGLATVSVAAGLWWTVSSLVALFTGGWIAARLCGVPIRITAVLHGCSVWALATLLAVWLATTSLSGIVSGAFGAVGQVGEATAAALTGEDEDATGNPAVSDATDRRRSVMRSIRTEAAEIYREVVSESEEERAVAAIESAAEDTALTPGDAQRDINAALDRLFAQGGVLTEEDRQEAIAVLSERTGLSEDEAREVVASWEERFESATEDVDEALEVAAQEASEAADAAADAMAAAAGWASFMLFLGLVAAFVGGMAGMPQPWMVEVEEDAVKS